MLTVREVRLEEVVVPPGDLLDGLGEEGPLLGGQVDEGPDVALRDKQDLERPDSPPGADDEEAVVLEDDPLLLLKLDLDVVGQQMPAAVLSAVLGQRGELGGRLLRRAGGGPDLAVGVRVGAAHGSALVLEDLHVAQLLLRRGKLSLRGQRGEVQSGSGGGERAGGGEVGGVGGGPDLDDGDDLLGGHVGEGLVVLGREGEDVAAAGGRLGAEEGRGQVGGLGGDIFSLLLLDGTVVVDEDEGVLVVGVVVAAGARVAGAEVALWSE
jgi:hypothetical protein